MANLQECSTGPQQLAYLRTTASKESRLGRKPRWVATLKLPLYILIKYRILMLGWFLELEGTLYSK